jgi:hypothetical protein
MHKKVNNNITMIIRFIQMCVYISVDKNNMVTLVGVPEACNKILKVYGLETSGCLTLLNEIKSVISKDLEITVVNSKLQLIGFRLVGVRIDRLIRKTFKNESLLNENTKIACDPCEEENLLTTRINKNYLKDGFKITVKGIPAKVCSICQAEFILSEAETLIQNKLKSYSSKELKNEKLNFII